MSFGCVVGVRYLRTHALLYLAGFLELSHFLLGLVELLCEVGVCMQTGYTYRTGDTTCVNVALEVVTADDTAFAHLVTALQDFVLAVGIKFGEYQGCGPTYG